MPGIGITGARVRDGGRESERGEGERKVADEGVEFAGFGVENHHLVEDGVFRGRHGSALLPFAV